MTGMERPRSVNKLGSRCAAPGGAADRRRLGKGAGTEIGPVRGD